MTLCSFLAFAVRFDIEAETEAKVELLQAVNQQDFRLAVLARTATELEPVLNA